jgi:hypothetical protein
MASDANTIVARKPQRMGHLAPRALHVLARLWPSLPPRVHPGWSEIANARQQLHAQLMVR